MSIDAERLQKRLAGMSERQMLDWLGVAISGMHRHLDAYERSGDRDHLGELMMAETTMALVLTELLGRKFGLPAKDESRPVAPSATSELKTATDTTSAPRRFPRKRFPMLRRDESGPAPAQPEATGDLYWFRGKEPTYDDILRDQGKGRRGR
jgi:hypothetical protein